MHIAFMLCSFGGKKTLCTCIHDFSKKKIPKKEKMCHSVTFPKELSYIHDPVCKTS